MEMTLECVCVDTGMAAWLHPITSLLLFRGQPRRYLSSPLLIRRDVIRFGASFASKRLFQPSWLHFISTTCLHLQRERDRSFALKGARMSVQ